MKRKQLAFLQKWLTSKQRKPLVIRGARQVGKTWLVRQFAKLEGRKLIEINLEKKPQMASFFDSNDPKKILMLLSSRLDEPIDPDTSLLFLDEIQAVPELFAKLRWLAEDMPQLPVIAAGSLLEFVLDEHSFSMPVGRINYMHMEPLSFEEFLLASNKQTLLLYINAFEWKEIVPQAIHEELMSLFKEYLVIGGMPAVVSSWITEHSLQNVNQIQHELMATYRDDFTKYRGRIEIERLDEILMSVPKLLGEKYVYSKVNAAVHTNALKQAFDLICKARVCHRVTSCHGNGIPLAAELDEKFFKAIFLDVGLCSASLGFKMSQIVSTDEIIFINKGGLAEQVVGQILRTIELPYIQPELYYWAREEKGSSAEVDYVLQYGNCVIPLEVKAGSTGSLKSLHLFMGLKKLLTALRVNSDYPSLTDIQIKDPMGNEVKYTLLSIPFYLLGQVHRLLSQTHD